MELIINVLATAGIVWMSCAIFHFVWVWLVFKKTMDEAAEDTYRRFHKL